MARERRHRPARCVDVRLCGFSERASLAKAVAWVDACARLVPGVLGKEMRLHPVNILFFTLATAELFGFLGLFLAVPAAALVQIVVDEFYLQPRRIDAAALDREAAVLVEGRK